MIGTFFLGQTNYSNDIVEFGMINIVKEKLNDKEASLSKGFVHPPTECELNLSGGIRLLLPKK